MQTFKAKFINRGQSTTMWMSVITIFLAVSAMPEMGKLLPQAVLPYMVILISIAQGIKRVIDAGSGSSTPYFMGIQALLATLTLPELNQILPTSSLPYLVSVISAINWYVRIFFPSNLEPASPTAITTEVPDGPPDVVIPDRSTSVDAVVREALHKVNRNVEP